MITFIYKVESHSIKRGYNQTITVWRLKHNKPEFVGYNNKIDTASTYGPKGETCQIIAKNTSYKLASSYKLARKSIQLFEV